MTFREVRERYLSSIYSVVTFILLTTSLGTIFLVAKFMRHQTTIAVDGNILMSFNTLFSALKVLVIWLMIPLLLATVGECIRWLLTSLLFKRDNIGFELKLNETKPEPDKTKSPLGKSDSRPDE